MINLVQHNITQHNTMNLDYMSAVVIYKYKINTDKLPNKLKKQIKQNGIWYELFRCRNVTCNNSSIHYHNFVSLRDYYNSITKCLKCKKEKFLCKQCVILYKQFLLPCATFGYDKTDKDMFKFLLMKQSNNVLDTFRCFYCKSNWSFTVNSDYNIVCGACRTHKHVLYKFPSLLTELLCKEFPEINNTLYTINIYRKCTFSIKFPCGDISVIEYLKHVLNNVILINKNFTIRVNNESCKSKITFKEAFKISKNKKHILINIIIIK